MPCVQVRDANAGSFVYWKEWLDKAFRETIKLFSPLAVKFLPPIFAPGFLYLEFGMGGLVSLSAIWKLALALAESYTLAFVAIYAWKLLAVVPMMLGERDGVIAIRDRRIAELTRPQSSPFRAQILDLSLSNGSYNLAASRLEVSVLAEFRNLHGPNTSIHSFQLWLLVDPPIASIAQPQARELDSGRVWKERFAFAIHQIVSEQAERALKPMSRWKVTFKDVYDTPYESEIFQRPNSSRP
jgi:hypothetical protein